MIYITRLLEFLLRKALAIMVVALLLIFGFYFAMNAANLYILAKEGLNMRAHLVMTGEGREEMSKYFTYAFIERDPLLQQRTYEDYTVRSFNHRMGLSWISYWPWRDEAELLVSERITYIDGELPEEKKTEQQLSEKRRIPPPVWENSRMTLRFVRQEGVWKIAQVEVTEVLQTTPSPSPLASGVVMPVDSPIASPTGTPLPSVSPEQ